MAQIPHPTTSPTQTSSKTSLAKSRNMLRVVFLSPAMLILLAVNIVPVFYTFMTSLQDYYLPFPQRRAFIGLENYVQMLGDTRFWSSMRNTLVYVGVCLTIELILGCIIALLLLRQKRAVGFIRGVLLLPILLTPVAVAFMWRLFFSPSLGMLNYILSWVGLGPFGWIYDHQQALISLIIVDVWEKTPQLILIIFTGLLAIPEDIIEAAIIDGASAWKLFWRVRAPILKPILMVGVLFRVIDLAKVFDVIFILTSGGPGTATETLSLYAYTTGFGFLRMGYSSALGIVLFVAILIGSLVIMRWGDVEID